MKLNTALQWAAGAALLLGSLGPWAWAEAYSNYDAQQPSESTSAACRQEAAWLRELRSSFDQGGSLGSWLSVAEDAAWRDLVVSVYLSELSPAELASQHYAGCMLGSGWEVEA